MKNFGMMSVDQPDALAVWYLGNRIQQKDYIRSGNPTPHTYCIVFTASKTRIARRTYYKGRDALQVAVARAETNLVPASKIQRVR